MPDHSSEEPVEAETLMRRAIELARRGEGLVEPNPMVGCVIAEQAGSRFRSLGVGWHQKFGEPHAEVNALADLAKRQSVTRQSATPQSATPQSATPQSAKGTTVFVTLEPCSHVGKTGPCTEALISANVAQVMIACSDPDSRVSGRGIARLRAAGIKVQLGMLEEEARNVLAPYLMRTQQQRPWVIAKWAMTLDGKIATSAGDSQWISNPASRAEVHRLRGRVDAIIVGSGTALADNPQLTVRPPGIRTPTRVVVDARARLPLDSHLVRTANETPTLVAVAAAAAPAETVAAFRSAGCEVFVSNSGSRDERLRELLKHLASSGATNVLVEGGRELLGGFSNLDMIDEIHGFIGPKLLGGLDALSPVGGQDVATMQEAREFCLTAVSQIENDIFFVARRQR